MNENNGVPMVLSKKVGYGWYDFVGSVSALNAYADLKAAFSSDGVGIGYPETDGGKIKVARPGLGEIEIKRLDKQYQVTLVRGKIASWIAGLFGKYN